MSAAIANLAINDVSEMQTPTGITSLAVETRLQIYGYVFIPQQKPQVVTEGAWAQSSLPISGMGAAAKRAHQERAERTRHGAHCCAHYTVYGDGASVIASGDSIQCMCAARFQGGQLLATCRQIFEEATPVLYEQYELRLQLPRKPLAASKIEDYFRNLQWKLSSAALEHIRTIRFVGRLSHAVDPYLDKHGYERTNIDRYCREMTNLLPRVSHVKMHVEFSYSCWLDRELKANMDPIRMIIYMLPQLRKITVELCRHESWISVQDSLARRGMLTEMMSNMVEASGRQIDCVEG